jgi:hypothetical protein
LSDESPGRRFDGRQRVVGGFDVDVVHGVHRRPF